MPTKAQTPRPRGKGYTPEPKRGRQQQTNSRSLELSLHVPPGWGCRTITSEQGGTLLVLTRLLADKEDMMRVIAQPVFSCTASDFHKTYHGSFSASTILAASRRGRKKS